MVQVNEHKEEQILISIAGLDRPGLTADVMRVLAKYDATVLDIGQSNIHSTPARRHPAGRAGLHSARHSHRVTRL